MWEFDSDLSRRYLIIIHELSLWNVAVERQNVHLSKNCAKKEHMTNTTSNDDFLSKSTIMSRYSDELLDELN